MEEVVRRVSRLVKNNGTSFAADKAEQLFRDYFSACADGELFDVTVLVDVEPPSGTSPWHVLGTLQLQVILTPQDVSPERFLTAEEIEMIGGVVDPEFLDDIVDTVLDEDVHPWFDARGLSRPVRDGDRRWVYVSERVLTRPEGERVG